MAKTQTVSLRIPTEQDNQILDLRAKIQDMTNAPVYKSEVLKLVFDYGLERLLSEIEASS